MPTIIGISAYFHDSACCLLRDGVLVAAAQEERFSRRKHDSSLPKQAFRYCLQAGGITTRDVHCVAYYEDPRLKLERQLWMFLPQIPKWQVRQLWWKARQPEREIREALGYDGEIAVFTHHEAHAASAFFYSGFDESAILTVDGAGEWATTTYGFGKNSSIEIFEEVHFPHSLGLLYSTFTNYLGFSVNDGEYKVMGLAPYGRPLYVKQIQELLETGDNGQYRLKLEYFDFNRTDRMYTSLLPELFGQPARQSESELNEFHKDLARSLQVVLETALLEKVHYLHRKTNSENLCMAGGVALNCVANGRILRDGPFERLFVQPAANDAGGCLGSAALAHARLTGTGMNNERMSHAYLGPEFLSNEICKLFDATPLKARDFRDKEDELLAACVDLLSQGRVIGWFHGRMEFGPRSLGARSILADPRDPKMRDRINALVKKRETFRPFAPAILESEATRHFALDHSSPFMLETCQVISEVALPAITHVDGSARVQTVDWKTSPRFARLLEMFGQRTGCPILLNTSFNMRDEPIVCSPVDAILCFSRSEIDALVLEDFIVERHEMTPEWTGLFRAMPGGPAGNVSNYVYTLF
jgi:carbamoyltransferase